MVLESKYRCLDVTNIIILKTMALLKGATILEL
jgi:hypothetical protein